jgi:hypothetical protein
MKSVDGALGVHKPLGTGTERHRQRWQVQVYVHHNGPLGVFYLQY